MLTRTRLESSCESDPLHHGITRMWLTANSILGSTYTGWFESVSEMAAELDEYEKKTGNYVPIHVDAASGGFVA
jgi:glutamate/tyrosine decarboxylase-like PLP-dependent enzyme